MSLRHIYIIVFFTHLAVPAYSAHLGLSAETRDDGQTQYVVTSYSATLSEYVKIPPATAYGDWHLQVPSGGVGGLLCSDANVGTCLTIPSAPLGCTAQGLDTWMKNAAADKKIVMLPDRPRPMDTFQLYCRPGHGGYPGFSIIGTTSVSALPSQTSCQASSGVITIQGSVGARVSSGSTSIDLVCSQAADVRLSMPDRGVIHLGDKHIATVSFPPDGSETTLSNVLGTTVNVSASVSDTFDSAGVYSGSTPVVLDIL